jgi:SWI/SNF-related matrix-associated actin-dependent regulator 1 of chromatin subfamily A
MASSYGREEISLPPSSPPPKRQKKDHNSNASLAYNSDADDGDELFEGYVPDTPAARSGAYQTQPTQIIDRSTHFSNASSSPGTPSKNEVQVPASSPLSGNGTKSSKPKSSKPTYNTIIGPPPRPGQNGAGQKRPLSSLMAPAGTTYKPPNGVVRNPVMNAPDEDEDVDDDDEDPVYRLSGNRKVPSTSSPTGGWKRSFVPGLPSFNPKPAATEAAISNVTSQKYRPSTVRKPSAKVFNLIDHSHDIQVIDSSSEDELNALADIRPSTFKSKTANNSFDSSPPSQSGNGNTKFHNIVSNATYNGPERGMPSTGSAFANPGMPFNATISSMSGGSRPFSSDSMSLGFGSARKPMQKKPERAAPVGEDLKIENLTDAGLRQKVTTLRQAFPGTSVLLCRNALIQSRGNLDDAAHYLAGGPTRRLSSDEVESPQRPVAPIFAPQKKLEAPQMKRTLDTPVISLIDKYSSTQAPAAPRPTILEIPKPKAKKLVQGRRNPSSPAVPEVSSPPVIDEFDSDSGVASATPEVDPALEDRVLKFLNTCTVEELVDLASTTTDYATLMIEARPFQSLDDADTVEDLKKTKSGKRSNRKPIGETIVQTCVTMFTGYEAIDTLVKKCDELGKPLLQEMSTWGFNTFGAAKGGEIEITSFDEQIASQRDSGIGSPASADADADADVDDDVKVISSSRKKSAVNFIKQPVMMPTKDAEDKPLLLKDYQVVGLNWLAMMYRHGLSGILADEMGLGKTLQVIALLAHLAETGRSGPHLVICPGSTLENWLREIRRFAPGLTTEPYHGMLKLLSQGNYKLTISGPKQQRVEAAERILERRSEVNIVVSTYDMAKNPDDNKFMRRLQPDVSFSLFFLNNLC